MCKLVSAILQMKSTVACICNNNHNNNDNNNAKNDNNNESKALLRHKTTEEKDRCISCHLWVLAATWWLSASILHNIFVTFFLGFWNYCKIVTISLYSYSFLKQFSVPTQNDVFNCYIWAPVCWKVCVQSHPFPFWRDKNVLCSYESEFQKN